MCIYSYKIKKKKKITGQKERTRTNLVFDWIVCVAAFVHELVEHIGFDLIKVGRGRLHTHHRLSYPNGSVVRLDRTQLFY